MEKAEVILGRKGATPVDPYQRTLLLIRLVIVFSLLVSTAFVSFGSGSTYLIDVLKCLYYGVALYLLVILVRLSLKERGEATAVRYCQIAVDAGFISLLVYLTGLYDSFFSFLYIIVIILGSLELYMAGGFTAGILSSSIYTILIYLQYTGKITLPMGDKVRVIPFQEFLTHVTANNFGFILSGILAGYLGNELKKSRKQVEIKETDIRALEDFNRNIIENITSGIMTINRDGVINFVNRTGLKIIGLEAEEVMGRNLDGILPGLLPGPGSSYVRVKRPELRYRRRDGVEIFLGFSFSKLLDGRGEEMGEILIFQDLTKVREMEERVELADRLAMLGELSSGLAHEIRNPLASIAGSAQILGGDRGDDEDDKVLLGIIQKESTRLNNLIKDFLTFARPEVKKIEDVDLVTDCEEVIRAVSVSGFCGNGVSVDFRVSSRPKVQGDSEKLKQVIWNLIINALQVLGPEGKVMVDVGRKRVGEMNYGCISVEDDGPGMDEEILKKVFDPFFTTKEGGTGLGLAVSSRIVTIHDGFMEVSSEKGRGTRFVVHLPERG